MKRLLLIVGCVLLGIVLLFGGIFVFFKSPSGQQWLSKKVSAFATDYLKTNVRADIRYSIPDWAVLENVRIEDQNQDTLLTGNSLRLDLDMWALLHSEVKINQIELEGATVNINRKANSEKFNYDFLVDAFASDPADTTSSNLLFEVRNITIKNTKVKFNDEPLNNKAFLKLTSLKTGFEALNPAKSTYHLKDIELDGLNAFVDFATLGDSSQPTENTAATPSPFDLKLKNINLTNATWNVRFADLAVASTAIIKKFGIEVESIELSKETVKLAAINLNAPTFTYDDLNAPRIGKGFDAGHVSFTNFVLDANRIFASADSACTDLRQLAFKEKSGVAVQQFSGKLTYLPTRFTAENLNFQTPFSKIGNRIDIRHPKLTEIAESLEKATLNIELKNSYLGLQDVEAFSPDLVNNAYFKQAKKDKIYIDGKINGQLKKLNIAALDVRGLNGGRLLAKGQLLGLPDVNKLRFDVIIDEFSTSKNTLLAFLPDSIKTAYGIPQKIKVSGKVSGKINDITTDLALESDIGNGKLHGSFRGFTNPKHTPTYSGNVILNHFNLNYLLKDSTLHTATINLDFNGQGLELKTMNTQVNGKVSEAYYNGYTYHDVRLVAGIKQNVATFVVQSDDENIEGSLNGSVDLAAEYPTVKTEGDFKRLDLKKLGFYAEPLVVRGIIDIDMPSTNPAYPSGAIRLQKAEINQGNGFVSVGNANLKLGQSGDNKTIELLSEFLKLNIVGQFDYATVADVVLTELARFFKVPSLEFTPITTPNKFTATMALSSHPLVRAFVPELTDFKPISLTTTFDNSATESINTSIKAPYVVYDSIFVKNAVFDLKSVDKIASYLASIDEVEASGFRLRNGTLQGDIHDNIAGYIFTVKDSLGKDIHGLAGDLTAINGHYRIAMQSEGTLLNYEPWQTDGAVEIHSSGIIADAVRFMSGQQSFGLNSQQLVPNAPIAVTSQRIDLKRLATAFLQDSTLVSGFLNANMVVENLETTPSFTGDFNIKELTVTQIAIGEMNANASNKGNDAISLNASLTGQGNDFRVFGDYNLSNENPLDMTLDIRRLGAETIEAFSFGEMKQAKGQLNGRLKLTGKPDDPILKGDILFEEFDFILTQLGSPYSIKKQTAAFKGQSMQLDKFMILDSLGQQLVTTGRILFPNLPNYSYKFKVEAANFLAANAKRYANEYFYGTAIVDATLDISGVNERYVVNGDVKVKPGSNVVAIMPEDESIGSEMEQLITFIDPKKKEIVKIEKTDEQLSSISSSSEMTLNVEVTEASELTILIDELSGDYLRVKGNGKLRTGFDASGDLFLFGDYIIIDGTYELSVSLVRKKFDVMNGSFIRWTGDPMAGEVNIKAAYRVETSLSDYLTPESTLPTTTKEALKRPMPITLLLYLKNNLLALNPSFAVAVYEDNLTARGITNIDEIRKEGITVIDEDGGIKDAQLSRFVNENYINQQALWLLASNRFSPFQNNSGFGGGFNAEAVARQSVSKLLSDQLDRLASNIIKGVDLNVGIASDYATETGERSTELNLGLSKAFLNDRLSVSVGRNFELEDAARQSTEIFDNITAAYKLSEDGQYRFKAYRKNQYQTVLEGFVVETGVGFVVTLEYDKFVEIFKRKRE